ncbi:MAG: HEAT repeat domain-containing protein [Oligoflexia bacterium]|nr:HEAT repeat domain-containing protein [Oligoflexia bacterium]
MTLCITLLSLALSLGPTAWAAPLDDLNLAAAADVPATARQEAFDRLVTLGNTDTSLVTQVATTEDQDTRLRWVSIRVLGHVGGAGAEQTVSALLTDPQPAIRAAAVGALGETNNRIHTTAIAAMLDDPAVIVRAEAATALGKLGDPTAVPALAKALRSKSNYHRDSSLWVRRHFVIALGDIRDKSAVPALLRAMDDEDTAVAQATIPAFEQIGGFSMGQGRTPEQQREAWRRWASAQIR